MEGLKIEREIENKKNEENLLLAHFISVAKPFDFTGRLATTILN